MGYDYLLPFSFVLGAFDRQSEKKILKEDPPPAVIPTSPVEIPAPPVETPTPPIRSDADLEEKLKRPPENWFRNTGKHASQFNREWTEEQLRQVVSGIWSNLSYKSRRVIWARYEGQARRHKSKEINREQAP